MTGGQAIWVARPTLPGAAARSLVDAAVAEAASMAVPVTVVIVDESGVLKEMCRMAVAATAGHAAAD